MRIIRCIACIFAGKQCPRQEDDDLLRCARRIQGIGEDDDRKTLMGKGEQSSHQGCDDCSLL